MSYDPKIHHRRSIRLQTWDYSWGWWYYITLCTHERECLFGEIVGDAMELNGTGKFVEEEWLKTSTIRPNVELDDYVIMPNHVHGIIIINDPNQPDISADGRGVLQYAPTKLHSSSQTLGAIVRGFKGTSTKRIQCCCEICLRRRSGNATITNTSSATMSTSRVYERTLPTIRSVGLSMKRILQTSRENASPRPPD